jgi:hypothetical protein
MYLASATRPDISFAMSKLSRFTSNPGDNHWRAFEQVMYYLAGTMYYKIYYFGYPAVLEGYNDANWISDIDELYVISGYVFTRGVMQTDNFDDVCHRGNLQHLDTASL